MKKETLLRALAAVAEKIAAADEQASDWLAERDRRRRQQAAFLRGIERAEGSVRKVAEVTGISKSTVQRLLDPEGHTKAREDDTKRRAAKRVPSSEKLGTATIANTPPAQLKRRPDWQPHDASRREMDLWWQQYLSWTKPSQAQARMLITNSQGRLPDAAYFNPIDTDTDGKGSVGAKG